jgi:hypothetical protein
MVRINMAQDNWQKKQFSNFAKRNIFVAIFETQIHEMSSNIPVLPLYVYQAPNETVAHEK